MSVCEVHLLRASVPHHNVRAARGVCGSCPSQHPPVLATRVKIAYNPRHVRAMPAPRPRQCPVPPGPGPGPGAWP
eukprot:gene20986-biopygen1075